MQSQYDFVMERLQMNRQVSRNEALGRNITRLAAIIHSLKKEGMNIVASREGADYVYRLT